MSSLRLLGVPALLALAATLVPVAQAADADTLKSRLDSEGLKYEVDKDGDYRVIFTIPGTERTQLVLVNAKIEEYGSFKVREVYSAAGRVEKDGIDGDKLLSLMNDSRRRKLGSWEVADGDVLFYVIKLPDEVSAGQLREAIELAAETADKQESELSGDRDDL